MAKFLPWGMTRPTLPVRFGPTGSLGVYQGFVLPAFYRRSEPAFDLARSFMRAFGASVFGTSVPKK
jgi:hypothetical protein